MRSGGGGRPRPLAARAGEWWGTVFGHERLLMISISTVLVTAGQGVILLFLLRAVALPFPQG